ncbi:MAG: hypothetical protein CSA49_06900 [Gammaproteobacteria bacterium]|nr:MAG: hypothetical protein CSA49_06900 [Gammaproteobacteria bacterium]
MYHSHHEANLNALPDANQQPEELKVTDLPAFYDLKRVEPYYLFANSTQLFFPPELLGEKSLTYINYELQRQPLKLENHVRKIGYCREMKHPHLLAALADLFLVLGTHGNALKLRLLQRCRDSLLPEDYAMLNRCADTALDSTLSRLPDACLFKQSCQHVVDFDLHASNAENEADIELIVETFIENSQIDQAMDLLEDHLLNQPEHQPLTRTLIDLYIASSQISRGLNFVEKLSVSHGELSDHWVDAEALLKSRQS